VALTYEERRERGRESERRYRASHPEHMKAQAERATARRLANPEEHREYVRTYAAKHREETRARDNAENARKRDLLRAIRLERGCADCGIRDDVTRLHFHHRDPATKSFSIVDGLYGHAWETVLAETEKCDVLCNPCHRARHRALLVGKWSKKHDSCVQCGKTDYRHTAFGLCTPCYNAFYWKRSQEPLPPQPPPSRVAYVPITEIKRIIGPASER
jgi:hypothetical protein